MKVLCTFPGKYGDLLWALPTVRAISRRIGAPVDLRVAAPFASIVPLLQQQPYLASVKAYPHWTVEDTAPISPRVPPDMVQTADRVIHLGYRGWPLPDVARHTWETAVQALAPDAMLEELDLATPWITVGGHPTFDPAWDLDMAQRVAVGFTDEHFELKFGLTELLYRGDYRRHCIVVGSSPRWTDEVGEGAMSWAETVTTLQGAQIFLGCCSALHVLAVAMGVPVVLMEPNPHRHNDVFYPLGKVGPQVTLVVGNDGQPTFDARHVADALTTRLEAARAPLS